VVHLNGGNVASNRRISAAPLTLDGKMSSSCPQKVCLALGHEAELDHSCLAMRNDLANLPPP
jgi:hypothetical protein